MSRNHYGWIGKRYEKYCKKQLEQVQGGNIETKPEPGKSVEKEVERKEGVGYCKVCGKKRQTKWIPLNDSETEGYTGYEDCWYCEQKPLYKLIYEFSEDCSTGDENIDDLVVEIEKLLSSICDKELAARVAEAVRVDRERVVKEIKKEKPACTEEGIGYGEGLSRAIDIVKGD